MRRALVIVVLAACKSPTDTDPLNTLYEGDDPGECSDGADNDRDGAFDCDDLECRNAPACNGGEADADADADTDADADADTDADSDADSDSDADTDADPAECNGPFCDLDTVELTYTFTADFWFNLPPDCEMVYTGTGAFYGGDDTDGRLTFDGTWQQQSTTCNPQFDQIIWVSPSSDGYHTFFFASDRTTIDHWFAHGNPAGYTISTQQNFYITDMYTPFDLQGTRVIDYSLTEQDAGSAADFTHHLEATFTMP